MGGAERLCHVPAGHLHPREGDPHDGPGESANRRRDVTTVMRLLADIQDDVRRIRRLLEEDEDGEEAASEDDA